MYNKAIVMERKKRDTSMQPTDQMQSWRETMPAWLATFSTGKKLPLDKFFASRIVFYPGSGFDGQPVEYFGSTHAAHCYIYADYGLSQQKVVSQLNDRRHGFAGYRTLARINLDGQALSSNHWVPHSTLAECGPEADHIGSVTPYAFIEVLERASGINLSGRPKPSTAMCTLVPKPPRERPKASSSSQEARAPAAQA